MKRALMMLILAALVFLKPAKGADKPIEKTDKDAKAPRPLNVKTVLPSLYEVGSRIKDKEAKYDSQQSENFPRVLTDKDTIGEPGKVSLVVDPQEPMLDHGYEGFRLRIVNRSPQRATFPAIDSCLYLVQEARNEKGEWLPLQRKTPATGPKDCAVGWHQVSLDPGEYWNLAAPKFTGSFKTKLRFRLGKSRRGGQFIYSSEFDGSINPEQVGNPPAATADKPQ